MDHMKTPTSSETSENDTCHSVGVSPSQLSEEEHPVDLPAADASHTAVEDDEDEGLDETMHDDPGQDAEMMLTILTAANVELDMDEEVEENDIVDDESDLSSDEVD
jgi:hypothetical protein